MTGNYTPGPWVLTGTAGIAVGTTYQESAVAVCVCQGTRTVREAQANARLIAAAPDLLDALEKCLNFISNTEGEIGEDLICGNAARAAIAKAEGCA